MENRANRRNGAFVSYCHADTEYLTRLRVHLAPYIREKKVDLWDDTRITPGGQWKEEIHQAMALARVAILLVSADFMASEFIVQNELPPLLERAEQQGMLVVPVILSSCSFLSSELACYQSFNNPSFPLTRMSLGEQEAIWAKLANYVADALSPVQINPQPELGKRPEMSTNTQPTDKSSNTQSTLDKAIPGGQSALSAESIIDSAHPAPEKDAEEVQTQLGATPFAPANSRQKHTAPTRKSRGAIWGVGICLAIILLLFNYWNSLSNTFFPFHFAAGDRSVTAFVRGDSRRLENAQRPTNYQRIATPGILLRAEQNARCGYALVADK